MDQQPPPKDKGRTPPKKEEPKLWSPQRIVELAGSKEAAEAALRAHIASYRVEAVKALISHGPYRIVNVDQARELRTSLANYERSIALVEQQLAELEAYDDGES